MAEDSAEIRGITYVIDGIPMSFEQMKAYRAEKTQREDKLNEQANQDYDQMIEDDKIARRLWQD